MERGYWFLVSEVWFLEPFDAQRTLGLLSGMAKRWPPDAHQQAVQVARWEDPGEAISIIVLNLAIIAGEANAMKRVGVSADGRSAAGVR